MSISYMYKNAQICMSEHSMYNTYAHAHMCRWFLLVYVKLISAQLIRNGHFWIVPLLLRQKGVLNTKLNSWLCTAFVGFFRFILLHKVRDKTLSRTTAPSWSSLCRMTEAFHQPTAFTRISLAVVQAALVSFYITSAPSFLMSVCLSFFLPTFLFSLPPTLLSFFLLIFFVALEFKPRTLCRPGLSLPLSCIPCSVTGYFLSDSSITLLIQSACPPAYPSYVNDWRML